MSEDQKKRARPVRKLVSFSDVEWATVERRMTLANVSRFDEFARRTILDSEVKVRKVTFDPRPLGAELARIGNNINQIARLVNIESVTTYEQMQATRVLVLQIQQAIEEARKAAE